MVGDDFFGLPEFVVNSAISENAGNGAVRVYNYVKRGGVLVPQFMALVTALDLVVITRDFDSAVQSILMEETVRERCAAHH